MKNIIVRTGLVLARNPKSCASLLYIAGTMLTIAVARKRVPAGMTLSVKDKIKIGLVWPVSLPLLLSK